jgi:hypothetical protein
VFRAVADAHVKSTAPTGNYAAMPWLRVRRAARAGDATCRTYLKFHVSGLTGTVTAVKLRLEAGGSRRGRTAVFAAGNHWREATLTWNRARSIPRSGLATARNLARGALEIDLGRSAIAADGTYSFAVASRGTGSAAVYSSREGAHPPLLVVTTS